MTEPMTVAEDRVFVRKPQVEEAPLSGELMLFDPSSSRFFVLNRTMAFIWQRCDGQHTVARMLEQLTQEFDGAQFGTAAADLERAIEELVSMGLAVAGPRQAQ